MDHPNFDVWSTKMQSRSYLSKHYPEFLQYLDDKYDITIPLKEKIYLYIHKLDHPQKCKICGEFTKYINSSRGYSIYCSSKCSNSDPDKKELTKNNMMRKYGVNNPSQLDSVKEKKKQTSLKNLGTENPSQSQDIRERFKNTMIERYGVEHPSQLDSVKEKKKQTSLKNWGVEHPSQLDSVKEKKKQTSLKNWGTETPMMSNIIKDKVRKKYNDSYIKNHPDISEIIEDDGERIYICKCHDDNCNLCKDKFYKINHSLYHSRNYQGIEKCTIKNPIDHKAKDTNIELFVRDILDSYNISYITNSRICDNQELDIFIPSKNIGIECNGIYWHSDKIKHPKYHFSKYKTYKDCDIQMLSIWEDWIKIKPKIVKSIILSKIGIYFDRIYARKCIIKKISHQDCKQFLEQNHIQGNSNSSIRYGLFYNDELVSVMCFGKKRRNMMGNKNKCDNEWELTRFCNKINLQVIGGASKLLKCFINEYKPEKIISFASHDISNGSIYKILGFNKEKDEQGSYWYIDNKTLIRYHRYCFRKSELVKKGYDKNMSEFEIMNNLPYTRIYDSGQDKYTWYNKKERP